jgi:hypothetical protein
MKLIIHHSIPYTGELNSRLSLIVGMLYLSATFIERVRVQSIHLEFRNPGEEFQVLHVSASNPEEGVTLDLFLQFCEEVLAREDICQDTEADLFLVHLGESGSPRSA